MNRQGAILRKITLSQNALQSISNELYVIEALLEKSESEKDKQTKEKLNHQIQEKLKIVETSMTKFKNSISLTTLVKSVEELKEAYNKVLPRPSIRWSIASFKILNVPFDEDTIKLEELEMVKKIQQAYQTIHEIQDLINLQLEKDTNNLDDAIHSSQKAVEDSQKANEELVKAAKYERSKKMWELRGILSGIGGILGNIFGLIGGFYVANKIANFFSKKHDAKIEAVMGKSS